MRESGCAGFQDGLQGLRDWGGLHSGKDENCWSWCAFPGHEFETRVVKEALKKAGIGAEVRHGRGDGIGDYLRSI